MSIALSLAAAARDLADALFDPRCVAGDHALDALAGPACRACIGRLEREAAPARCGACSAATTSDPCAACLARPRRMRVHAPHPHRGVARSLVLAAKAARREDVVPVMARHALHDPSVKAALLRAEVIVPVPADPVRRHERGFDHALSLAECLAAELARDGERRRVRRLLRVRAGARKQSSRSGRQRRRALRGFITARLLTAWRVRGLRVTLVDDVVTTGATAAECARLLLRAGAAAVEVVAFTRAEGPLVDSPRARGIA